MHPMTINGIAGIIIIRRVNDGPKFSGVANPTMIAGTFLLSRGEAANDPDINNPPPERA